MGEGGLRVNSIKCNLSLHDKYVDQKKNVHEIVQANINLYADKQQR